MLGRNDLPAALYDAWIADEIQPVDVLEALCEAYSSAEFPLRLLDIDAWVDLFNEGPYLDNGKPAKPPTEPIRLYRAAEVDYIHGLSWTSSLEQARWFHERNIERYRFESKLVTTIAPPVSLLARIDARKEEEYLVDPELLDDIQEITA